MNQQEIKDLIQRYNQGLCTERERALLETWYAHWNHDGKVNLTDTLLQMDLARNRQVVLDRVQVSTRRPRISLRVAAAAAAIVCITLAGLYFGIHKEKNEASVTQYSQDIAPGKQGATLTLANGQKIRLSEAASGELLREAGMLITKQADGQLLYEIKKAEAHVNRIHTLSTDRGETYQVQLPDGSQVWLNAASSLTYNASLNQDSVRKVSLEGEAYFEVFKDKQHPFIVESKGQEVVVLGTHFNVSSYPEDRFATTTLLEGSVKIQPTGEDADKATVLIPNQQALLKNHRLIVSEVEPEYAVAWQKGYFIFNSENLESVMRKLARWYQVDVQFEEEGLKHKTFFGTISRFENISKILHALERTGVARITLENNTVTISKNQR